MKYLTRETYFSTVNKINETSKGHWSTLTNDRWDYFGRVINLIKELNIAEPLRILEMGTVGISCVMGTHTIDYADNWDFPDKKPTYLHDARVLPWPIKTKHYELFIALRVYQHLAPFQKDCMIEAMRVAKKVIIVVPPIYELPEMFPDSRGITYSEFVEYLHGVHPNIYCPTLVGDLYFWDTENPSTFNLEGIMQPQIEKMPIQQPRESLYSSFTQIKNRIKK